VVGGTGTKSNILQVGSNICRTLYSNSKEYRQHPYVCCMCGGREADLCTSEGSTSQNNNWLRITFLLQVSWQGGYSDDLLLAACCKHIS
jgi:hypothetical protein